MVARLEVGAQNPTLLHGSLHESFFFSPQKQQRVFKLETIELNYLEVTAWLFRKNKGRSKGESEDEGR